MYAKEKKIVENYPNLYGIVDVMQKSSKLQSNYAKAVKMSTNNINLNTNGQKCDKLCENVHIKMRKKVTNYAWYKKKKSNARP